MPHPADDDISLREIARTLKDFRDEFRTTVMQLVRTDVYRAEQAALERRITELEKDRDQAENDKNSGRRNVNAALIASLATFLSSLVMFIILLAVKH